MIFRITPPAFNLNRVSVYIIPLVLYGLVRYNYRHVLRLYIGFLALSPDQTISLNLLKTAISGCLKQNCC